MSYTFNPFTGNFDDIGSGGDGGGDITSVTAGTGLSGGGTSGDVTLSLANTAVTPASYTYATITVDAQGRITSASSGTTPVTAAAGTNTQIQFNDSGPFAGDSGLTFNKTTNLLTIGASTVDGGQAKVFGDINLDDGGSFTTTIQCVTPNANRTISFPNATGTVALVAGSSGSLIYNNAGAYAGVPGATVGSSGNLTLNASSGFSGNLLDLQVNGTARAWVTATGGVVGNQSDNTYNNAQYGLGGLRNIGFGGNSIEGLFIAGGDWRLSFNSSSIKLRDGISLNFGTSSDLSLNRDAAGIFAQRNGTNAQTFRVYNTYTSSTNYELGKLEWSSNVFRIGTEKGSGGGTARSLELQTDGTTRLTLGATDGSVTSGGQVLVPNGSLTNPSYGFSANTDCGFYIRSTNQIGTVVDGTLKHETTAAGFDLSDTPIRFSSNVATTASDVGLSRSAAGVVKVTNGSTGDGTISGQLRAVGTAPASASATGTAGDIRYDADYVYVCTATNTWKRAALATW